MHSLALESSSIIISTQNNLEQGPWSSRGGGGFQKGGLLSHNRCPVCYLLCDSHLLMEIACVYRSRMWVRMECQSYCSPWKHTAPLASTPAGAGFTSRGRKGTFTPV